MSILQHERISLETSSEREVRLQHTSERVTESRARRHQSAQLDNELSVQIKMRRFHAHFASLSSPKCSNCLESFPGLQLRVSSTECMR